MNARQNLGAAIRYYRDERSMDQYRVADIVSCSTARIDDFERGRAIPDDHVWQRMVNILHRDLGMFSALRQRALAEEEAERQEAMAKHEEKRTKKSALTTPLKDSIVHALDEAKAKKKIEEEKKLPPPEPPPKELVVVTSKATSPAVNDIQTIVKLVVEAIPSLHKLTIEIDASGNASCTFVLHETRIVEVAGSVAVSR